MKRHPSLAGLSRDHHGALVLARALQADTPAELRGGLPVGGPALLSEVNVRFATELAPHFAVEERELLPLSECGDASLRAHGERIRAEHAELRALATAWTVETLAEGGDAFGKLLVAHVRFEEREWFPALEAALDAGAIERLVRRLQLEPESLITGYHLDGDDVWVADLDCGHARHVRHAPPFHEAQWVTSDAGRADMLGRPMTCPSCRMPRMPPCAQEYKSTPVFDRASVPAGLLRSHTLRAGTWGEIVVDEGRVAYVLEDEGDLQLVLRPGVPGVVAPGRPHHVRLEADARFHVRFMRCTMA